MAVKPPSWVKLLRVGDYVYSAYNGQQMKITEIFPDGFNTEEDFYEWDEHRDLFFLHPKSYKGAAK